jgi:hypothetical protein
MDADQLIPLLGRRADDPAIESAFRTLRTLRRPELDPEDRDAMRDWVLIRRAGIELGFIDSVYFKAGDPLKRRRPGVPILLNQIYLYRDRDDISEFVGRLPYGLQWSDDRAQARARLQAWEATRRSYLTDVWDTPECRLVLAYRDQDAEVDNLLCMIKAHDWPEEGRVQPSISIADWTASFGLAASSALLQQRLQPLDLAARRTQGDDPHEVDFRTECGLELYLSDPRDLPHRAAPYGPQGRGSVLAAVQFLASREYDARQWAGELPFGLSFEDSQEAILAKVGRPPVEQEDEQFEGMALWRFPELGLEVRYNNVENRLVRIMILAPGYAI